MVSPNLLKSQIPMSGGDWGGGWWKPISKTFDGESKFSKITNSHVQLGGGGVGGNQFPTFDAESKFAKITNSHVQLGGGGLVETNFQLLMLSPNLLKSQIPMSDWGWQWWKPISKTFDGESKFAKIPNSHVCLGGGVGGNQFPTFDAESKFAKITNSHVQLGGRGWWKPISNF